MNRPMHYPTRGAMQEGVDDPANPEVGMTYETSAGNYFRWTGTQWKVTDTPAPLRPDDPPWYREPTADKPGQVRRENLPLEGWEYRPIGGELWRSVPTKLIGHWVAEARRIEPDPEPVTVAVPVVLLERLLGDSTLHYISGRSFFDTAVDRQAMFTLIAEARR